MRENVRHRQKKRSFPLKKLLTQPVTSNCSENSEHPWCSRFIFGFSWQYNLFWSTAFLIVFHFFTHYQRRDLFQINIDVIQTLNAYECHWSLTKEAIFSLRRLITVTLQVPLTTSISAVDIFLRTLQEFINIVLKEHFRKAGPAAFLQIKI